MVLMQELLLSKEEKERNYIKYYKIDKCEKEFLQATSIVVEDQNDCITISATYSLLKHTIKKK